VALKKARGGGIFAAKLVNCDLWLCSKQIFIWPLDSTIFKLHPDPSEFIAIILIHFFYSGELVVRREFFLYFIAGSRRNYRRVFSHTKELLCKCPQ
jgi:hypothetical protein